MKLARVRKSMVRAVAALLGILLVYTLAGCGGSAVSKDGTTAVTVTVGGGTPSAGIASAPFRATPRPLGSAIPSTVTAVRFTIGGEGIDDIVQTVPVTGTTMTVTLQVPSGPGRTILVEALDSDGISRFRGSTAFDASGVALSLTIGMAVDPSNPALQAWNIVDSSASSTLYRIAEGDGILMAGGAAAEILSSSDGISWTARPAQSFPGNIDGLAFGNHTFLAMRSTFTATSFPGAWTTHFFGATSDNVDNWTTRGTIASANVPFVDMAFGGGVFVAIGDNNAFYSQDNGATWLSGTISGVSYLSGIAYGNGRFVTPDGYSDNVAVSTDGIHWTTTAAGLVPPDTLREIGFGNGLFLLTTSEGDAYTSADGISWQKQTRFFDLSSTETSVYAVVAGGGGFMIVSSSGFFFTFDSGATWIPADPGVSVYDGMYWNGAFVAVGSTGPGSVFRSGDL